MLRLVGPFQILTYSIYKNQKIIDEKICISNIIVKYA